MRLGFDYLRDNMVVELKDKVQRGHVYAIVDEVDSILIDEATHPAYHFGARGRSRPILYETGRPFCRIP